MRDITNKVAVVTGAAGGIGRAITEVLAENRCHVVLVDIDEPGMEETIRRISRTAGHHSRHCVDVADSMAMSQLADDLRLHHDAIDILINNAGITMRGSLEETSCAEFESVVRVNLLGVVHGCITLLPLLRKAPCAHIVNMSSVLGLVAFPTQSSYSASKFAIRGFSEALRCELHGTGIGVTCAFPGAVDTNILKNATTHSPDMAAKLDRSLNRFMPSPASPNKVANRIVRAIRKNRPYVIIRPEAHFLALASRLAPRLTSRMIAQTSARIMRAT